MAVSITLVPTISEAYAISNASKIKYTASKTIIYTSIIGIGATSLFMAFPNEICMLLYNDAQLGSLLFKLSLLCPFLYMQITFSGLLNGLGEHMFIFKNNLLSSVINIFFIYFFMPKYGIDAFIFGWFISLVATSLHSMFKIGTVASINYNPKDFILKPVLSAAVASAISKLIFLNIANTKLTLLISILFMYILYFIMLFLTQCLNKNDMASFLPAKH